MATVTTKIVQIGNSLGVILPKAIAERFDLDKGDQVAIIELSDGLKVMPGNPEVEEQLKVARKVMKDYRNTLRELAK